VSGLQLSWEESCNDGNIVISLQSVLAPYNDNRLSYAARGRILAATFNYIRRSGRQLWFFQCQCATMTTSFIISEVIFVFVLQCWQDSDQCTYSPVRLIKLNQSELEFGAKIRRKKKKKWTNGSKVYKNNGTLAWVRRSVAVVNTTIASITTGIVQFQAKNTRGGCWFKLGFSLRVRLASGSGRGSGGRGRLLTSHRVHPQTTVRERCERHKRTIEFPSAKIEKITERSH